MAQAMGAGLLRGNDALVHLVLHQGVIAGELFELTFAIEVGSAVTHMAEDKSGVPQDEQFRRAAHAAVFRLSRNVIQNSAVSLFESLLNQLQALFLGCRRGAGKQLASSFGKNLTRQFARGCPAHPIRQKMEPHLRGNQKRILIIGSPQAGIGFSKKTDGNHIVYPREGATKRARGCHESAGVERCKVLVRARPDLICKRRPGKGIINASVI